MSQVLKWYYKNFVAKESKYESKPKYEGCETTIFHKPKLVGFPFDICTFPSDVGPARSQTLCSRLWTICCFQTKTCRVSQPSVSGQNVSSPGCDTVRMSWVTRGFTKIYLSEGCTSKFLQIAILWLKRYLPARWYLEKIHDDNSNCHYGSSQAHGLPLPSIPKYDVHDHCWFGYHFGPHFSSTNFDYKKFMEASNNIIIKRSVIFARHLLCNVVWLPQNAQAPQDSVVPRFWSLFSYSFLGPY